MNELIIIRAKRWFDGNNTYHSVEVYVDGKFIGRNPFEYGYDECYLQSAHKILQEYGYYPKTDERLPSGMDKDLYDFLQDKKNHRENFLIFCDDVTRKKDL